MKLISNLSLFLAGISLLQAAASDDALADRRGRYLKGRKSAKSSKSDKSSKSSTSSKDGAVYTMSNAEDNNELIVFSMNPRTGRLTFQTAVSMNGSGAILAGTTAGDPLASQDPLITDRQCVIGVNAGSDTIASFRIKADGYSPRRARTVSSFGPFPISLASNGDGIVYVLNAGQNGSISGYRLNYDTCVLRPIPNSTVELPNNTGLTGRDAPFFAAAPAQIGFDPNGNLLVTIKSADDALAAGTGSVIQYTLDERGRVDLDSEEETTVSGTVPFSFDFDRRGNLLLAEAFGTAAGPTPDTGAVISYSGIDDFEPVEIERVETGGFATCWLRYSERGNCVFTTNNLSSDISSLRVRGSGNLELIESTAAELDTPVDFDLSSDGRFLYALSTGSGNDDQPRIYTYRVTVRCGLREIQAIADGIPNEAATVFGAAGLAVL